MKAAAPSASKASRAPRRAGNLVRLGLSPHRWDHLIALAGNPNVGKTTVFNALTGLRRHTGNWPGKTVARAEGAFLHDGRRVKVVDLPGTYSLHAGSADEEVARDFVLFGQPDVTVVVVDATRLERNLNLVLQILEITDRVVVCLNLVDEARRHGISVDAKRLERELGVPVVPAVARRKEGIEALLKAATEVATGARRNRPHRVRLAPGRGGTGRGRDRPAGGRGVPGTAQRALGRTQTAQRRRARRRGRAVGRDRSVEWGCEGGCPPGGRSSGRPATASGPRCRDPRG